MVCDEVWGSAGADVDGIWGGDTELVVGDELNGASVMCDRTGERPVATGLVLVSLSWSSTFFSWYAPSFSSPSFVVEGTDVFSGFGG